MVHCIVHSVFPRLLESPGIFIGKRSGPGKSWSLLGNDVHDSFRFQIDMFMQTKIAMVVANRYVFWASGLQKILLWPDFCPGPHWGSLEHSPEPLTAVYHYI